MPYLVYKIANTVNDKLYIGRTIQTLEDRWRSHYNATRDSSKPDFFRPIYVAMREYGIEKFSIEPIEVCVDEPTMLNAEAVWIRRLRTVFPQGYNLHCPLTTQEVAIIKYDAFGWSTRQYATFYGISVQSIRYMRGKYQHYSYPHITRSHLILEPAQLLVIGQILSNSSRSAKAKAKKKETGTPVTPPVVTHQ